MAKLLTHDYSLHICRQFLESISEVANTAYYMFMGDHVPRANTEDLTIHDTVSETLKKAYHGMIQGKRIAQTDATEMIRNIPYAENKVFAMYDDQDDDLLTLDYYCVVNASAYYHVYKCLDNNLGANSTSQPDFSHIVGANTQVYQTADGYRWKYMYSVSDTIKEKFSTVDYFPVIANTEVEDQAVDGVLDIIRVEGQGRGYHNYLTGTFGVSSIRVNGNSKLYAIANSAVSVNGYYTGCMLYISSGTGVGSYSTIADYFFEEDGNYIELEDELQIPPINGSTYEIYPRVDVFGSGATVNVVARALVNAYGSNSIYRVEVLDRGADYTYFEANVIANSVVGVAAVAELRPIYAPNGGHGKDAAAELAATRACISVRFSNSESNTILTTNGFQQIGLLKDPMFANVQINLTSLDGTFLDGELVFKIDPVQIDSQSTVILNSTEVNSSNADFEHQMSPGEYLYLTNTEGTSRQLVTVNSVTNSTQFIIGSNAVFACTATWVHIANVSANGYVLATNSETEMHLTNVAGVFAATDLFVGTVSGAKGVVDTVEHNDVEKGFQNFIQLHKYTGIVNSGEFEEDEIVEQTARTHASLHSAILDGGNTTFYTSNQVGTFEITDINTIVGNTSGAIATLTHLYSPELVFGSGQVLYLENIEKITRQTDQSETLKIVLEF